MLTPAKPPRTRVRVRLVEAKIARDEIDVMGDALASDG